MIDYSIKDDKVSVIFNIDDKITDNHVRSHIEKFNPYKKWMQFTSFDGRNEVFQVHVTSLTRDDRSCYVECRCEDADFVDVLKQSSGVSELFLPKYRILTENPKNIRYNISSTAIVYTIEYLIDIPIEYPNVNLGGYVSKDTNISHYGLCCTTEDVVLLNNSILLDNAVIISSIKKIVDYNDLSTTSQKLIIDDCTLKRNGKVIVDGFLDYIGDDRDDSVYMHNISCAGVLNTKPKSIFLKDLLIHDNVSIDYIFDVYSVKCNIYD